MHLWMHGNGDAQSARLGQKGGDSSLGQASQLSAPAAEGERGWVGKRGRAGCSWSWGGVVRLKDESKHKDADGNTNEPPKTTDTPTRHGLGRCAALARFGPALSR